MKQSDFEIWDLHCHLSGVDGRTVDEKMAEMMRFADRMGVARMIFFMGWPWSRDPNPEEFRRQNDQVLQALSHWHDRAFGLAYLNPRYPDECLAEIERVIVNGPMVGIKLWVAVRCSDPRVATLVRRVAELDGLIYQHTWNKSQGNLPGESTPADLAALADRHAEIPLICGHSGGEWEGGIRSIRRRQNVSLGTGGFDPVSGYVEMAVREVGDRRIIFGSDVGGRSFASQLGKILGARISDESKHQILGGNLKRMLTPILLRTGRLER